MLFVLHRSFAGNEDHVICITLNKNNQGLYVIKQDLTMSVPTKVSYAALSGFLFAYVYSQ